jgi:hypothetical protein
MVAQRLQNELAFNMREFVSDQLSAWPRNLKSVLYAIGAKERGHNAGAGVLLTYRESGQS